MPKSGLTRMDKYIRHKFEDDDHSWAEQAIDAVES